MFLSQSTQKQILQDVIHVCIHNFDTSKNQNAIMPEILEKYLKFKGQNVSSSGILKTENVCYCCLMKQGLLYSPCLPSHLIQPPEL